MSESTRPDMDESATETAEVSQIPGEQAASNANGSVKQTPEQLVARAIAPVKEQFLRPPPVRTSFASQNDDVSEKVSVQSGGLVKEKKSKRQLKRERRQVFFSFHITLIARFWRFSVIISGLLLLVTYLKTSPVTSIV